MNKIAAGEVIERPASVVKELVENSIDAGSSRIDIEIEDAGLKLIRITDNGSGIDRDDLEPAFKKHSTSKIRELDDLDRLATLGFRGEALPSIASVSKLEVITNARRKDGAGPDDAGTKLVMEAGKVISTNDIGCPGGTIISIKELFYNVPARKKFLKRPRTEMSHITEWVMRFALAYPGIRFSLKKNGSEVLSTPGRGDLTETVVTIFGASFARQMIPVEFEDSGISLSGFIGKPVLARRDTSYQFIFVNGRYVTSNLISRALSEAYHTMLMKNRFPSAVLFLRLDPARMDVNIHPTKLQVRFMDESRVYSAIVDSVKKGLIDTDLTPELQVGASENGPVGAEEKETQQLQLAPEHSGSDVTFEKDVVSDIDMSAGIDTHEAPVDAVVPESGTREVVRQEVLMQKPTIEEYSSIPQVKLGPVVVSDRTGGQRVYRPLGQIHDSYLIVQTESGMLIIDQHALHERVMYEKYRDKFGSMPSQSQELIVPLSLEFNSRDYELLLSYSQVLKELGFDLEPFGKNTIRIRSIPIVLGHLENRDVINDVLDDLLGMGRIKEEELMREKIIQIMACKSAIKAGDRLDEIRIRKLLESISDLESPYTCAHGRPTILTLSLKELEKQFKRTGA